MPLYGWVREYLGRYSFIRNVTMKNARVFFWYYDDNDVTKELRYKVLPYRANKMQVEKMIERIKKEINYGRIKEARDLKVKEEMKEKDLIFTSV